MAWLKWRENGKREGEEKYKKSQNVSSHFTLFWQVSVKFLALLLLSAVLSSRCSSFLGLRRRRPTETTRENRQTRSMLILKRSIFAFPSSSRPRHCLNNITIDIDPTWNDFHSIFLWVFVRLTSWLELRDACGIVSKLIPTLSRQQDTQSSSSSRHIVNSEQSQRHAEKHHKNFVGIFLGSPLLQFTQKTWNESHSNNKSFMALNNYIRTLCSLPLSSRERNLSLWRQSNVL